MSEIIFDIEADGLLDTISKVWIIVATDAEGTRQWIFTDEYLEKYTKDGGLEDGVRFLLKHYKKICHNIMGYDWHVLHKFWPNLWNLKTAKFKTCWDTLVQSKCQHYDRPRLKGTKSQHGLEYYGLAFGYPKPPIEDWTYFDEEKVHRALVDIEINRRTYAYLNKEAERTGLDFETQIRRTQATQYWYTLQELHGTYGNTEKMRYYVNDLDKQIAQLRDQVEPYLPPVVKSPSPKVTWEEVRDYWDDFYRRVPRTKYDEKGKPIKKARKPVIKITKANGEYTNVICKWFDIPQCPDFCDEYVAGPFTKVQFVPSKMSQHAVVKDYLLKNGWKPTQWNFQKNADGSMAKDHNNKPIKKSPKLTEDSFDSIKGDTGQKIAKYNTLVHRRRTILNEKDDEKGWLNQIRPDGRIPAGAMAWATGTGRAAQFGIVNVPSSAATYGAPMREVWEAPEGKTLVSVDMDSAQMRLLANFMGDDDYTKAVMEGEEFDEQGNYLGTDAHTLNAIAFGTLDEELVERARETQDKELIHECSKIRKTGKNGFYALIFGAGDVKLANTLKLKGGAKKGAQVKDSFRRKLRKMDQLQKRLVKQWKENPFRGGGYIQVAGGTWVWCPSEHKLLNYLLMGSEAVLQNEAICWVNPQIKRRKLQGAQLLSIHDELTFEFVLQQEKEAVKLLSEMYGVASEKLGLDVLVTGTAQSGKNWLEIH